jgi:hypothetical protein
VALAHAGGSARGREVLLDYDFQCQSWMFQNGPIVAGLLTMPSKLDL